MEKVKLAFDTAAGHEHVLQGLQGFEHTGKNADADDERDAVPNAAFGDLLAEPHQQHGAGGEQEHGLKAVPEFGVVEDKVATEALEDIAGTFPADGHHETLSQTEDDSQIAAVLLEFGPASFFLYELAEPVT